MRGRSKISDTEGNCAQISGNWEYTNKARARYQNVCHFCVMIFAYFHSKMNKINIQKFR